MSYENVPCWIITIPHHLKTQEIGIEAVEGGPWQLEYVPDRYKIQEISGEAVRTDPQLLKYLPDQYKTQEMRDKAVTDDTSSLGYFPDWFVTRQWYDDSDYYADGEDNFFKWHDGYKKRKAQKALIKEEFLLIAWHSSRQWDWCMPEDEKKETEKLWE